MKERVPRQMGSIAESKGPCLEPISALIEAERVAASTKQRKRDWDEKFEDGTWATCRHVSCITANEGLI
jgi:hypothetical protein